MLCGTLRNGFRHLVREVDQRGFMGDFRQMNHVNASSTQKHVAEALREDSNMLFCGPHRTGKLTILKAIGKHLEEERELRVSYISADSGRANRFDGLLLHHFLGLRLSRDELPSQEQLEGTLSRHVRLVESTYAGCIPSLCTVDALLLDSMEKVDPVVLASMEAVCRRQRGRLTEPFGGLRVYAAADFWRLPVHPSSDTGGYLFQAEKWDELFPRQRLLHRIHGQSSRLNKFTEKAFFGNLSMADITDLEAFSSTGQPRTGVKRVPEGDDSTEVKADNDTLFLEDTERSSATLSVWKDAIISNMDAITRFTPRFPKQPAIKGMPTRYRQLKRTEIGNFLVNMLMQSSTAISFGFVDALSVDVGSRVHLLLDGQSSYGVPAGTVGEVMQVREHIISVHFPSVHRTVDIPRMRISCYHPDYPEVRYELQQFPLFPRQRLCPMSVFAHPNTYHLNINGRRLADTNDLGNLLARMRSFSDFTLCNTADFANLDGMVHEPTRIYYHQILDKPISSASEQWCRNCKSFVPTTDFFAHWATCVKSVRWCTECSKTVPLELLGPHQEKHQVVMCLDCGKGVEWRYWEAHRLSCGEMMREVSPDNQFLPLRTRQLALELGLDKRDLHTMRAFSKSMLPRSRKDAH